MQSETEFTMPLVGDRVYYKLGDDSNRPGEVRPAVIVRVWSEYTVNLLVFLDGENDKFIGVDGWTTIAGHILWKTSVPRIENAEVAHNNSWFSAETVLEPGEIILDSDGVALKLYDTI